MESKLRKVVLTLVLERQKQEQIQDNLAVLIKGDKNGTNSKELLAIHRKKASLIRQKCAELTEDVREMTQMIKCDAANACTAEACTANACIDACTTSDTLESALDKANTKFREYRESLEILRNNIQDAPIAELKIFARAI